MDPGESCDDGNRVDGDGCSARCGADGDESCGNGLIEPGEACDHGGVPSETCDGDCTAAACGDGVSNPLAGEQCDDGGESASCNDDCTVAWCGDGQANAAAGEQCDHAGISASCDYDCSPASCGDGLVNAAANEECDTASETEVCDDDCTVAWCGDGARNETAGEQCDDGNRDDEDGCSSDCAVEVACADDGDGVTECTGMHLWSRGFGGTVGTAPQFTVDGAGNVLLSGRFWGTVDFGGGPLSSAGSSDIFVVKLDTQGQHLWSRRFGGTDHDGLGGIAVDSAGNVLLSGTFLGTADFGGGFLVSAGREDIFTVKLNPQGQHLWSHAFGTDFWEYGKRIATDSAGNVLLTGRLDGPVDFGGGPVDVGGDSSICVVKLDPQGEHLWSRAFSVAPEHWDIEVDSANSVLLAGYFGSPLDFGGGPLPDPGHAQLDIFVVKLDAQGQHLWSHSYGGDGVSYFGLGFAVDSAGNVLLTGSFHGTVDFGGGPLSDHDYDIFAVKLDAQGQHLWSHRFGGTDEDSGEGITVDSSGNVLLTGLFGERQTSVAPPSPARATPTSSQSSWTHKDSISGVTASAGQASIMAWASRWTAPATSCSPAPSKARWTSAAAPSRDSGRSSSSSSTADSPPPARLSRPVALSRAPRAPPLR